MFHRLSFSNILHERSLKVYVSAIYSSFEVSNYVNSDAAYL